MPQTAKRTDYVLQLCVMSDVCEDLCGVEKRRLQQFVVHRAKKMWVGFPVLEEIFCTFTFTYTLTPFV